MKPMKYQRLVVAAISILLLAGCNPADFAAFLQWTFAPVPIQVIKTGSLEGVILSDDTTRNLMPYVVPHVTGIWTPTPEQVMKLDSQLAAYLKQAIPHHEYYKTYAMGLWDRLSNYYRQFVGVIIDNQRLIYGSYFCKHANHPDEADRVKRQLIVIEDGLDCVFYVLYDPQSSTFTHLEINSN